MKSKILTFIALFLFFAGVFSSCKKTETENPQPHYPIKISFEEYSLEGTPCQWKNLSYNNSVVIINSKEELEQYITCHEGTYPIIDFVNHSLLLASGKFYSEVLETVVTDLRQHSSNKYSLDINIILSDTAVQKSWIKALIVKKIPEDSKVKLHDTFLEQNITYPVDVPFLDYSLEGTECKWIYIYNKECIIINTKARLERFCLCNNESTYPEIDFSKYTLILAGGLLPAGSGLFDSKSLKLIDKQKYILNVKLKSTSSSSKGFWYFPILVNKISDYVSIELIVEVD